MEKYGVPPSRVPGVKHASDPQPPPLVEAQDKVSGVFIRESNDSRDPPGQLMLDLGKMGKREPKQ